MLVTGAPGVGKTTLVQRLHERYKRNGLKVAGVTTREVRTGNQRVGFRITDLSSGTEGWLARTDEGDGPRIGKYIVCSDDLERIGVNALSEPPDGFSDIYLVDEIGPMEMTSSGFRAALTRLLSQSTIVVATVKFGSHYPEVEKVYNAPGTVRVEVTKNNREKSLQTIISAIDDWMA